MQAASLRRSAGKTESDCCRKCEVEDVGFCFCLAGDLILFKG